MKMKFISVLAASAVLGLGLLAFLQRREINRLHVRVQTLGAHLTEAEQWEGKWREAIKVAASLTKRFESERRELFRLRGQMGRLRELEQDNARLLAGKEGIAVKPPQVQKEASPLWAAPEAEDNARAENPFDFSIVDFGMIRLSPTNPVPLDLGNGSLCQAMARPLENGNLQMVFTFESEVDGIPVTSEQEMEVRPGVQISGIVNGVEICFVPELGR